MYFEYDASIDPNPVSPQFALGNSDPIKWNDVFVYGTAIVLGNQYYAGGWSKAADPIGRLELDGFEVVGTENLSNLKVEEVEIFPNPVKSVVNIKLDMEENHKNVELSILDINGKVIQKLDVQEQHGITPVNISSYPSGTYIFSVKTEKSFDTQKVINE